MWKLSVRLEVNKIKEIEILDIYTNSDLRYDFINMFNLLGYKVVDEYNKSNHIRLILSKQKKKHYKLITKKISKKESKKLGDLLKSYSVLFKRNKPFIIYQDNSYVTSLATCKYCDDTFSSSTKNGDICQYCLDNNERNDFNG